MRVRRTATSGVAVPSDVVPVGPIPIVQHDPCFAQKLKRLLNFIRREIKDSQPVRLRDDDAAPAKKVAVKILGVHEQALLALDRINDASGAKGVGVTENAVPRHPPRV